MSLNPQWLNTNYHPYIEPEEGRPVFGLSVACAAVCTAVTALRFVSRATLPEKKFGADDWTCLIAWPFAVGLNALAATAMLRGAGNHLYQIPLGSTELLLKLLFAGFLVYNTGIAIMRISACFFYMRIFTGHHKIFRVVCWASIGTNVAWLIGNNLTAIFQCSPVRGFWDRLIPGLQCASNLNIQYGGVITGIVMDLWTLLLPMPIIWKLKMPPMKKALIIAIFVLGYSVIVLTIGKLVTIVQAGNSLNTDLSWVFVNVLYWFVLEMSIADIGISLPSIFNLVSRIQQHGFKSLFSSASRNTRPTPVATTKEQYGGATKLRMLRGQHRSWAEIEGNNSEGAVTDDLENGSIRKTTTISVTRGS